jgi:hypothetical protein
MEKTEGEDRRERNTVGGSRGGQADKYVVLAVSIRGLDII